MDFDLQEADRQSEDESPSTQKNLHRLWDTDEADIEMGQGVYVLTDNSFKPFSRMSMASSQEAVVKAQPVREPLDLCVYW